MGFMEWNESVSFAPSNDRHCQDLCGQISETKIWAIDNNSVFDRSSWKREMDWMKVWLARIYIHFSTVAWELDMVSANCLEQYCFRTWYFPHIGSLTIQHEVIETVMLGDNEMITDARWSLMYLVRALQNIKKKGRGLLCTVFYSSKIVLLFTTIFTIRIRRIGEVMSSVVFINFSTLGGGSLSHDTLHQPYWKMTCIGGGGPYAMMHQATVPCGQETMHRTALEQLIVACDIQWLSF